MSMIDYYLALLCILQLSQRTRARAPRSYETSAKQMGPVQYGVTGAVPVTRYALAVIIES